MEQTRGLGIQDQRTAIRLQGLHNLTLNVGNSASGWSLLWLTHGQQYSCFYLYSDVLMTNSANYDSH